MTNNNNQNSVPVKQLIVLGNGFDLSCGLKSSYSDFFNYRFKQISEQSTVEEYYLKNIQNVPMEKLKKLLNNEVSIWDIIFITEFINAKQNKNLEWNNIEHMIYKVLHYISTYDESTKLSDVGKQFLKNISTSFNYSKFLFEELQKFEHNFEEYILNQKLNNNNYLINEVPLKLSKIIDFNVLLNSFYSTQSKDVSFLSFNYTLSKEDVEIIKTKDVYRYAVPSNNSKDRTNNNLDSIINKWINIHGKVDYNVCFRNPIIFGIDSNIVNKTNHTSPEYKLEIKFTKTFRVAINNSLHSITSLPKNINLITFYGHSLSSADFSYFESIFDMYNLYSSELKLEFFFGTYDFTWEEKNHKDIDYLKLLEYVNNQNDSIKQSLMTNIYNLLNDYGSSLSNNHGDNLLHRLLLEGRISFKEDMGSFKLTEEQIKSIKK